MLTDDGGPENEYDPREQFEDAGRDAWLDAMYAAPAASEPKPEAA